MCSRQFGQKSLILLAVSSALALLSMSVVQGPAIAATSQVPTTITFMTWENEEKDPILDRFMELNPDIKVKKVIYPNWNEYPEKVLALAATGLAPDVMWLRESFAPRGVLLDLGPLLKNDPTFDADRYFPGVLSSLQFGGKQYALPRDLSTFVVYYNEDRFSESGLAVPKMGWTYQDLMEYGRKLTRPERKQFAFGMMDRNRWGIVDAFGGTVADSTWNRFIFDEPAVQAIQWIADWRMKHHFDVLPTDNVPGWAWDHYVNGNVAMMWEGPWSFGYFKDNLRFNWGIAVPPKAKKIGSNMMVLGIGISATSKHVDAAYRLLKFLAHDTEAQVMQVQLGIASPSVRDPKVIKAFLESPASPKTAAAYLETLYYLTPTPEGRAVGMDEALRRINDAITKVLEGQDMAATVMPEAVRVANEILARARSK